MSLSCTKAFDGFSLPLGVCFCFPTRSGLTFLCALPFFLTKLKGPSLYNQPPLSPPPCQANRPLRFGKKSSWTSDHISFPGQWPSHDPHCFSLVAHATLLSLCGVWVLWFVLPSKDNTLPAWFPPLARPPRTPSSPPISPEPCSVPGSPWHWDIWTNESWSTADSQWLMW